MLGRDPVRGTRSAPETRRQPPGQFALPVPGTRAGGAATRTPAPHRSGKCRYASRFGAGP